MATQKSTTNSIDTIEVEILEPKIIQPIIRKDLKTVITELEIDCLDFDNLWAEFKNVSYSEKLIERDSEEWIFNLEKKDSLQFEQAHLLSPKCKIYENENIISVAFVDLYDYKTALHLFTFKKPELTPTSSFVFYLVGGDGEDFWSISPTKLNPLKFSIVEEYGYDNNAIRENEFLVKLRQVREYTIDQTNGKLTKNIIKTEKDLIEMRE